jgi:hypothetical protein
MTRKAVLLNAFICISLNFKQLESLNKLLLVYLSLYYILFEVLYVLSMDMNYLIKNLFN